MSDESAPPEPRLKLKRRSDGTPAPTAPPAPASPGATPPLPPPAAPEPAASTPAAPAEPAPAAPERIKLRARIPIAAAEPAVPDQSAPAKSASPPAGPVADIPAPAAAAASAPPMAAATAGDAPVEEDARLKLKPKSASGAPTLPPAAPSAEEVAGVPADAAAIFKAISAAPVPPSPPPAPPPPAPVTSAALEELPEPGVLKKVLMAIGIVLVVLLGARFVYQKFFAPLPPLPKPVAVKSIPPKPAPVPAAAPTTVLGQAVLRTRETVAAVASGRMAAANEVMPSSRTPAAAPGPVPAGGSGAAPAVAPAPPRMPPPQPVARATRLEPSAQFRQFVDKLKIGGSRFGPPARVLLDGVMYQQGAVIDDDLGVVFVGIDSRTGDLIFKDSTGAEVRRIQ